MILRPQAASSQATKIFHPPATGSLGGGWARPVFFIYISRHPQPPAKDIGFYRISKELFCRTLKINILTTDLGFYRI